MNNSYYCSECVTNWSPHHCHATKGACPLCGGGTVRRQEPISDDADDLYRKVVEDEQRAHQRQMFEDYYKKHCEATGIEYEPDEYDLTRA